MKFEARNIVVSTLLAAAGTVSAAGIVDVSFVDSARYTDAGTSQWERAENLQVLEKTFHDLGQRYLRSGEVLKVEVLDVDLAGTTRPWHALANEMRVVRGTSDWPRMQLRYSLELDGKPVRSGGELLADLDYTGGLSRIRSPEPLQYEKKMLDKWFKSSFAERHAAN